MLKKFIYYLIFISSIAFFYVTCSDTDVENKVYKGKVVKVTDGDSIRILADNEELRIRLAEIDAPEKGQPFWKKSKDILAHYVAGKVVDVLVVDTDHYNRIVGHVYIGDTWVNGELVRGGYAYVYPKYATNQRLYEYEQSARENQIGIWVLPENERIKPWEWRKKNR